MLKSKPEFCFWNKCWVWRSLQSGSMKRNFTSEKNKIWIFQNFPSRCPWFSPWQVMQAGRQLHSRQSQSAGTATAQTPALPRPGSPWTWAVKKPWVDCVWCAGRKAAASGLGGKPFALRQIGILRWKCVQPEDFQSAHMDLVAHQLCVSSSQISSFPTLSLGNGKWLSDVFFAVFSVSVWCWV